MADTSGHEGQPSRTQSSSDPDEYVRAATRQGLVEMADDPKARRFYVSWVDRRKDPWPKWADTADGQPSKKGTALLVGQADDPEWPAVPKLADSSRPWFHLGPTLTALFHPRSPCCNLRGLDRVYLLYEPELGK